MITFHQWLDLPYKEWVNHVFDHPVTDPAWHWDDNADTLEPTPKTTVEFLTTLFSTPDTCLEQFSDEQLNQGFWYLVSNPCSSYMFPLLETDVPWPQRKECIRSISTLFELLFAKRCSPHLSHFDESGANPLNGVCYMWWDIFPSWGNPDDPDCEMRDQELLKVMERILSLDSIACLESALHGLSHWHLHYPQKTSCIIDHFLKNHGDMRIDLREYALAAQDGGVE
ncbi:MAG: hypothetical protein IID46_12710 [Planctomycetes bacterium]|nr:hypothetical protein [Planctomycetota bacterium]